MVSLPKFQLSGEKRGNSQAELNPPPPAASWSGYPPGRDDELIGMTLNSSYFVEAILGEGGMGRVYSASHTRIPNKRFAIKVLRAEFTRNAEIVARFRREAEAAACISHPNVVEVYDVDETPEGLCYIVCEYLAGLDLYDYLAQHDKLETLAAVNVALQLCRALEAAHEAGVLHRDVKPHNIFLLTGEDGDLPAYPTIKILDFGLSRFMDADSTQLTRAGVIMGTPSYMSPEQAEGRPTDARTDVYGVGAVMFAALTGRAPYEADTLQALVLAVINQAPARPRSINPEIPENLELIVQRAMSRSVQDRYQTMSELRLALEAYYDRQMADVSAANVSPRSPAPTLVQEPYDENVATARPRLLGYGALLLLLAAAGLFTSVSSVELWTGRLRPSRLEAWLLSSGVIGTLLTPALLLLRRFRRSIWSNHSKVLALLATLRAATTLGLLAYGVSALALHALDDVVSRFVSWRLLGSAVGSGFRGFNAVLFLVGATWASLSIGHRWGDRRPQSRTRDALLALVALVVSAGLLYGGLVWRDHCATEEAAALAAEKQRAAALATTDGAAASVATTRAATDTTEDSQKASTLATERAGSDTSRDPQKATHASVDELANAASLGLPGLMTLAERYPEDPDVLRPLLYAFASRATGLADAMAIAQRLLRVAPEDAHDADLRYLVRKAAQSPGEASRIAFVLMSEQMGAAGPDLLYDLYVSEPKAARRAEQLLASPTTKTHFSPALAIAYDLRHATSCAARIPLLGRAAALGDRRSVAVLTPLSASSKHGCGHWKRSACPPACPEEARAYLQTVAKIMERQPSAH
jgi:serine/threonine protein kinase